MEAILAGPTRHALAIRLARGLKPLVAADPARPGTRLQHRKKHPAPIAQPTPTRS
jgi:hypothetical protein